MSFLGMEKVFEIVKENDELKAFIKEMLERSKIAGEMLKEKVEKYKIAEKQLERPVKCFICNRQMYYSDNLQYEPEVKLTKHKTWKCIETYWAGTNVQQEHYAHEYCWDNLLLSLRERNCEI